MNVEVVDVIVVNDVSDQRWRGCHIIIIPLRFCVDLMVI